MQRTESTGKMSGFIEKESEIIEYQLNKKLIILPKYIKEKIKTNKEISNKNIDELVEKNILSKKKYKRFKERLLEQDKVPIIKVRNKIPESGLYSLTNKYKINFYQKN